MTGEQDADRDAGRAGGVESRRPAVLPSTSDLRLRAERPKVVRLSRYVVWGLAGTAMIGIGLALGYALQNSGRQGASSAVQEPDARPSADGLDALPKDYTGVPKLGPPLPGDLGKPILKAQQEGRAGPVSGMGDHRAEQEVAAAIASKLFVQTRDGGRQDNELPVVAPATGGNATAAQSGANDRQAANRAFLAGEAVFVEGFSLSHVLPTGRRLGISMMLALGTSLSALGGSPAFAQQGQTSISSIHLDIPRQPLSAALQAFSRRTGIQVVYTASIDAGIISPGISGDFDAMTALSRLLSGTGVTFRQSGKGAVVLAKASANITLGPVRVGGTVTHENPTGPGVGYVATTTMSATKTDTPIVEIPNSIYVVTKQQMIDQGAQTVMDALKYTAGIYAGASGSFNNGNAAADSISFYQRGFSTKQFVDGLLSNSQSAGETAFLERIEAINGPASVMYGQTTPGGMLAMSLKKPTDTPLHQVSVGFGNWGRYETTVDFSDKLTKSGNLRYRVAAIGVTQGTQTDHVDYHRVGVLPSITWDIDHKTSLTLLGMYMYTPGTGINESNDYPLKGSLITDGYRRIPRSNFLGATNWNTEADTTAMFEYQFQHKFNKYINFSQTFRYEQSSANSKNSYYDGSVDSEEIYQAPQWAKETFKTTTLDTRVYGKFQTGPLQHTWVVGSDFRSYHYNWYYQRDKL
ncbi:TonB-dependent siderophore receptor [Acetobacter syzygii]|uniref:TonB-dependent siderophore receptor n=1 Tax=Acetobacter syzygii TaxID=146476 RepID=UPI0039E80071